MIIAVPHQVTDWLYPMGGTGPSKPPYLYTWTWWRWYCTDCRVMSKPENLWSWLDGALDRGEYHEELAQCQVAGQLSLFPEMTNAPRAGLADRGAGRSS